MSNRANLFGIQVDAVTMTEAVERLIRWTQDDAVVCRYVVTPNVDHILMLQTDKPFRDAYHGASLVLADGWPVVMASRMLGQPLPERVAGSDLAPALFAASTKERPLSVYLLGAKPGVGDRAAETILQRWPTVRVVGKCSPPLGFEKDTSENQAILENIAAVEPDVLIVGLGAPKQELWLFQHRQAIRARVALGVGATIDFFAGEQVRAPRWMQKTGLEWFHRLATNPRRLAKRYLRSAIVFPTLLIKEMFRRNFSRFTRKNCAS